RPSPLLPRFSRLNVAQAWAPTVRRRSEKYPVPFSARVREPAAEIGQLIVVFGPENEMPVVRHQHESEDAYGALVQSLGDHADKSVVIGRFLEQGQAGHGSVERVVNVATRSLSRTSGHDRML